MNIILGNFFVAIGTLLGGVINIFIFLMIARAVISWVSPDPRNMLVQFIYGATEPILSRVRGKIPPIGMLDLSVIVVILGLYFLDNFLVETILQFGHKWRMAGQPIILP